MNMERLTGQYQQEIGLLETRIRELRIKYRGEPDAAAKRELSARIWKLIPILIENRNAYKLCKGYCGNEKRGFSDGC